MKYIFLIITFILFTSSFVFSQDEDILISADILPDCNPELDFCRQVSYSQIVKDTKVSTIDAGSRIKRVVVITASVDGSIDIPIRGDGIDSAIEVSIFVEGQGLCASDHSFRKNAKKGNVFKASATCVTVIEGVKTVHIVREVAGGMINTILTKPDNTKLRYSWAKLRKVSSIN